MSQLNENTSENAESSTCSKRLRQQISTPDAMENSSKRLKFEPLTLVSLNDDVLLNVFLYLNWMDTINLVASSNRFSQLKHIWVDKRRQEFPLDDFMKIKGSLPKDILTRIAPEIRVLETNQHNMEIMKSWIKLESLRITYTITFSAALEINLWIKELKLKHLRFISCHNLHALLHGVFDLQELEIICFHRRSSRIIAQNTNLERLSIAIDKRFDGRAFRKLQALQCLHIKSDELRELSKVKKFANFGNLTEFSFESSISEYNPRILNTFIKHLSKESKLDKLQLLYCYLDKAIFAALKTFNLSALSLCCDYSSEDLTNFILANPSPRLKHLKLCYCSSEQLWILLEKWSSLETVCLHVDNADEHRKICDLTVITNILRTSRNRRPLRIHIRACGVLENVPLHTEICVDFGNQQITQLEPNDEFYCSFTKSFTFSPKECFDF